MLVSESIDDEVDIPLMSGRHTRSQGPVPTYPNVQPSILELKHRKH